jgi:hypothetical protein
LPEIADEQAAAHDFSHHADAYRSVQRHQNGGSATAEGLNSPSVNFDYCLKSDHSPYFACGVASVCGLRKVAFLSARNGAHANMPINAADASRSWGVQDHHRIEDRQHYEAEAVRVR